MTRKQRRRLRVAVRRWVRENPKQTLAECAEAHPQYTLSQIRYVLWREPKDPMPDKTQVLNLRINGKAKYIHAREAWQVFDYMATHLKDIRSRLNTLRTVARATAHSAAVAKTPQELDRLVEYLGHVRAAEHALTALESFGSDDDARA